MIREIFIADCRYFEEIKAAFGENRVFLPSVPCDDLDEPVSCHPDMVLFPAGRGKVICAPNVFEAYQKLLAHYDITVLSGETVLGRTYPADVAYNVLRVGAYAFARWDMTDTSIRAYLQDSHISFVQTSQGYALCSSLQFRGGIMTADPSVKIAAESVGLEILSLSPGHICLPGYDTGFIGGAAGLLDENTVAFFGDLSRHPNGKTIKRWIENRGGRVLDFSARPLTDVGTILRIEQ